MAAGFTVEANRESGTLVLHGALDLSHIDEAEHTLHSALGKYVQTLDASGLTRLDTVGALLLRHIIDHSNSRITLAQLRPEHQALFSLVAKADIAPPPLPDKVPLMRCIFDQVGKLAWEFYDSLVEILGFFGQVCVTFAKAVRSPRHFRFADITHHIEDTGIYALPIIGLISFLVAIVLAYQSYAQLRPIGGERFTVNLVAISVLREMGVLLTAIMVAGRSGSAFTAEIGVMKVREEVDALKVTGIDPFEVLVMPRLIALIIALPLLTFLADLSGLFGGGLVSLLLIDIPLPQYMERARAAAHLHDFVVGMAKAPVFAFLIAMVGCMHGMKVSGSAESVGKETTASVVKSIFLVLVADAIFSIIFERLGV